MRADDDPLGGGIAAGLRHVRFRRGVAFDTKTELPCGRLDGRVGTLFARAIWVARYARLVQAVAAQLVEQRCGKFALCCYSSSDIHGGHLSLFVITKQSRSVGTQ